MDSWMRFFAVIVICALFSIVQSQTAPGETCFDSWDNCDGYIVLNHDFCKRYRSLARIQCQKTCHYCTNKTPPPAPPSTTTTIAAPTTAKTTKSSVNTKYCKNNWGNVKCSEYDPLTCHEFVGFFSEKCSQFCGYCDITDITSGFHGKCLYKGTIYKQGEKWFDGCDYECVCKDGKTGEVECSNRCPAQFNVPPECAFIKKEGECCLQLVCNFGGILHVKKVIGKGQNANGNAACIRNNKVYGQGAVIQDDCKTRCMCTDASKGEIKCHDTCPTYDVNKLPSNCYMHKAPDQCCEYPKCDTESLVGVFIGSGTTSGKGIDRKEYNPKDIEKCKDLDPKCSIYGKSTCKGKLKRYMTDKCPVYCGVCDKKFGKPEPTNEDKCYHQGLDYKTGDVWRVDCEHECVCDDQLYGYYHCYSKCPQYKNVPVGCTVTKKPGECCPDMVCDENKHIMFSTTNIVNIGGGDHVIKKYGDGKKLPVLPPVLDDGTVSPDWEEPKGIVGCLHNGQLLVEGQISPSKNCSDVCHCVDEHRGQMVCYDRCSEYEVDKGCEMVEDPNDSCCSVPKCPSSVTKKPKKKPKNRKTVTGKVTRPDPSTMITQTNYTSKTTPTPSTTDAPLPESARPLPTMPPNHTITEDDRSCKYKGRTYKPGERWVDGCAFNCLCIGGAEGEHTCLERCKRFVCPDGKVCKSYVDKTFPCCTLLEMHDSTPPTTPATITTTPESGTGQIPKGWLLLLKGVSGVSGDLHHIWTTSSPPQKPDDNRPETLTPDYPGHFKSVYAERFEHCRFEKIRMSIYHNGVEKAWIVFNAKGTDKTSWFDGSKIESSSWSDLKSSQSLHLKYQNPARNRQFEVFKSSSSACANDGWLFVSTVKGGCDYYTKQNDFHYSPLSGAVSYGKMQHGDVFAIMAQGGVCDVTNPFQNGATTEPPKPTTKKPTPPTQPTKTPTPPAQSTKHPTPPAQSTKHPTPPAQSTKKPTKQPYTPPMPRTHPKAPPVVEQAHPTTSFTGHDFYCDAATVFVYIPVRLLPNSKLTLQDNACVFDNNGTHYVIKFKFDQCGSSVEHSENGVIVTNKINVQKDLGEGFIAIEFDEDFKIPISCVMNRSAIFEGAIETVERDHIWEWEDKPHFNQRYRLRVFKTEEYLEDITDFPAQIPINREVFLQLSAADWNTDVGLQIEECFATPTEDVEDPVSYSLVRNGCPVSPAVHMVSSSTATRRRFKVQAFRFSDKNTLHNLVHFHCRVTYCRPESCTNASCTGSARNLRKRATRRDLDRGEYVTFGPLNVL